MAFDAHTNLALSTVAVAPSPANSGTTLTPTITTYFPDPASVGAYNVTVWANGEQPTQANAEILRITAKSGAGVLTTTRAQEGTAARSIVVGDQIAIAPTKKTFTDLEDNPTFVHSGGNVVHILSAAGAYGSYWQLASAGGTNEMSTDAAGDWRLTSNGVATGVITMIHAGAIESSVYVEAGSVRLGQTTNRLIAGSVMPTGEKGLWISYGTQVANKVSLQAEHNGTAYRDLLINYAAGNVGIGKDPGTNLDIGGANNANIILRILASGSGVGLTQIGSAGGTWEHIVDTSGNLVIGVNGGAGGVITAVKASAVANSIYIDAGKVGIVGAPLTNHTLTVYNSTAPYGMIVTNSNAANTTKYGSIAVPHYNPGGATKPQFFLIGGESTSAANNIRIGGGFGEYLAATAIAFATASDYNTATGTTRLIVGNSGAGTWLQLAGYGAGALTTDGSGNVTAVSDERRKTDIRPFGRSVSALMGIQPILYKYSVDSGLDTAGEYAGFSAQNVLPHIPEAIGQDGDGWYTINDRPVLAAVVNTLKQIVAVLSPAQKRKLGVAA